MPSARRIHPETPLPQEPRQRAAPTGLWLLLAVELALLVALLAIYVVMRESYPHFFSAGTSPGQAGWGLLQLFILLLAGGAAALTLSCLRDGLRGLAMMFLAATLMFGLTFLGALAVERMGQSDLHAQVNQALAIMHEQQAPLPMAEVVGSTVSESAGPAAWPGDPGRGAGAFAASCAACHGAQAEGISVLAPPLRDTSFMQQADRASLFVVTVAGRSTTDPANQTGRAMPPRGGNPFLTDDAVHDIVAFLFQLNSDGEAAAEAPALDAEQLVPRWVVPAPADGPQGLATDARVGPPKAAPPDVPAMLLTLFAGLQVVHVAGGLALASLLFVTVWAQRRSERMMALSGAARLMWLGGVLVWLVVLFLFYR